MGLKKIYRGIEPFIRKCARLQFVKRKYKKYFSNLKKYGIEIKTLTKEQKKEIRTYWGTNDLNMHKLYLSVTGRYDVKIVPERLMRTKIEFGLNNQRYTDAWDNKNFFEMFFPDVKFPNTIVRNINGVFYDSSYNIINAKKALDIMKIYPALFIKPTDITGTGQGVSRIKAEEYTALVQSKRKDYIVQEVLIQHPLLSSFNPSSVNIIRINTLFINEQVRFLSASLRCGEEGQITDSRISKKGKGNVIIGIDENGKLKSKGYHPVGLCIEKLPNGVEFASAEIPNFEKAKELCISMHSKMPMFGFIGFDIAIDPDGEPVVMEYNVRAPGSVYYEYTNGPFFGEYTDDIIKNILHK